MLSADEEKPVDKFLATPGLYTDSGHGMNLSPSAVQRQ